MTPSSSPNANGLADLLVAGDQRSAGTRAERLAALVEARIAESGMTGGESLGTLAELVERSQLSRATVREAVRLLQDRGVLTVRPGKGGGLFVQRRDPVVRMRRTLLSVPGDPVAVADAIELRNHLEVMISLAAARNCGAQDAATLREGLASMQQAPTWVSFVRANWSLHERIAALCVNAAARTVYLSTLGLLGQSSPQTHVLDPAAYRAQRQAIHEELIDAIIAGDEAAVEAAVAAHNSAGSSPA